jgi:hypothetical protein
MPCNPILKGAMHDLTDKMAVKGQRVRIANGSLEFLQVHMSGLVLGQTLKYKYWYV